MPLNVPIFRLSSSVMLNSPFVDKYLVVRKTLDCVDECREWVCLWVSFVDANVWKTFDNSKFSNGKNWQKLVFFRGRTRIGRVGVVYFNLKLSVYVDVEVVCVCRPSTRPSSRLSLNIRPCNDFKPYLWHSANNSSLYSILHTTSFFFSSLFTTYYFTLFLSITSFRARGGLKGGCYTRGLRGERRGGEKGWGRGIRSSCTSNRGFRPNFDAMCERKWNLSKKNSRFFWILTFFAIYLLCEWDERRVLKVQIKFIVQLLNT